MQELPHVLCAHPRPRILQITDVHHFPQSCVAFPGAGVDVDLARLPHFQPSHNVALLRRVVQRVRPHLVVFTGDILDGRGFAGLGRESWRGPMLELVGVLVDEGVLWTFSPGNHDDDHSPWQRSDLLSVFSLPNCATPTATDFSFTFTFGPVPSRRTPAARPLRVFVVDSGGNSPDKALRYDPFPEAVLAQFREGGRWASREEEEVVETGVMYFHIPFAEYGGKRPLVGWACLFDAALRKGQVPSPWCYVPWLVKLLNKHLVVGCSLAPCDLFASLAALPGKRVCATFCGHDHYNDFVVERDGVFLCYGRVSGHTPPIVWEGNGGPLPFERGARVVEHDVASGLVVTWNEGEHGGREEQSAVVLHARNGKCGLVHKSAGARGRDVWIALLTAAVVIVAWMLRQVDPSTA